METLVYKTCHICCEIAVWKFDAHRWHVRVHLTTSPAVPRSHYQEPQKDTAVIRTHHMRARFSRTHTPIPVTGVCRLHPLTRPLMDACCRPTKELLDVTPHTLVLQPAFPCESEVPSSRPLCVSTAGRGGFLRASATAVLVLSGWEWAGEPGDCLAVSRCWPWRLNGSSPPAPPPSRRPEVAASMAPKSSRGSSCCPSLRPAPQSATRTLGLSGEVCPPVTGGEAQGW